MSNQLKHRGPDNEGFYLDNKVALAHTRLSIIDLEGGTQPIHNEDKTIWTIFNGEIFNYIELRDSLKKQGHQFYTNSDTEVIVHLYEEYGDDFVQQLNGQFAIALWDISKKRFILIRDRVGIAPLFYKQTEDQLVFASEIKAINAISPSPPSINPSALDQLLTFWSPVSPETIFKDIFEVSPGMMLIIDNDQVTHRRYWDWNFPEDNIYNPGSETDLTNELHHLLVDSTQIRLRSDVPVGAYLSGGLDSSALVSLIHNHSNANLRTFSIMFNNKIYDESNFQSMMIKQFKTNHSHIMCHESDIADGFMDTIWHTESPILRTAPIPMRLLSKLAHDKNYKVVLTGEGSDEVLGGYDIFKEAKLRQFWARIPDSQFRPTLLKRLYPYLDVSPGKAQEYLQTFFGAGLDQPNSVFFSHLPRWITTSKCKHFLSKNIKDQLVLDAENTLLNAMPVNISKWHNFNRSQYIESKTLMAGYLLCSQGDRMLMANSVEGRFPFLDHRVIEFANSLHPKLKMKALNEKYLLKKSMKSILPAAIINRHKQPYRAPDIPSFYTKKTPEYVNELLSERKLFDYGYFDPKKVSMLIKKIKSGRAIGYKDNMAFTAILSTQVWHFLFIEQFRAYTLN